MNDNNDKVVPIVSEEKEFYVFYRRNPKIIIMGTSLLNAKEKAIAHLKVPKKYLGELSVVSKKAYDNDEYRYQ